MTARSPSRSCTRSSRPGGTERFLREIQIAARLSHPHILPLFDSGEADGYLYYVMPFVAGESLSGGFTRGEPGGRGRGPDTCQVARPGLRAQAGRRPPRHQAREHPARRRPRGGRRFRHRPAREAAGDERLTEDRPRRRDAGLHEPGADRRRRWTGGRHVRLGCVLYEMLGGTAVHRADSAGGHGAAGAGDAVSHSHPA